MPIGDDEIAAGTVRVTYGLPQRAPKQRIKVRGKGVQLAAWVELGKMIQAAKKLDEPIRGKGKRPLVGTYTRKDAGRCRLVQRQR